MLRLNNVNVGMDVKQKQEGVTYLKGYQSELEKAVGFVQTPQSKSIIGYSQRSSQPKKPFQNSTNMRGSGELEKSPEQKARKEKQATNFRSENFGKNYFVQEKSVSVSQNFKKDWDIPVLTKESTLPYYEPTKCSSTRNGIVKAYAANTNQGIVRDYNEDRVSIILNIVKPQSRQHENWPNCSFFGVYDGHGGAACADFLRDNLHQFVVREPEFPWNPTEALRKGFEQAEQHFLELALNSYAKGVPERSGSCAIIAMVIGDVCYIANVGDSRAIMSVNKGKQVVELSRDHKPGDDKEQERIQKAGGKIYQTKATTDSGTGEEQVILGPLRVIPGRLSVSRTFGDIEAKLERFGGNPQVIVAQPEICSFKIQPDHDFLLLASDGIYDKMTSKDVQNTVWLDIHQATTQHTQHSIMSNAVEAVLKESINRRTLDNITVVMIQLATELHNLKLKTAGSVERETDKFRQSFIQSQMSGRQTAMSNNQARRGQENDFNYNNQMSFLKNKQQQFNNKENLKNQENMANVQNQIHPQKMGYQLEMRNSVHEDDKRKAYTQQHKNMRYENRFHNFKGKFIF